MSKLKVGDWVLPSPTFPIIDAEKNGTPTPPITTREHLQIRKISPGADDEQILEFRGRGGKYLAAFFDKTSPP